MRLLAAMSRNLAAGMFALAGMTHLHAQTAPEPWVGTWAVAPTGVTGGFGNKSLRQIVHTSIGGDSARVTLSNLYGAQPVVITNVYLGQRADAQKVISGTNTAVTFNRQASVTIPAGGSVQSDAVPIAVQASSDLVVSMYVPNQVEANVTGHFGSLQDVYVAPGNVSASSDFPSSTTNSISGQTYYFLTAVDVLNDQAKGAVVTLGASITDGIRSRGNENRRWPNLLATRLQQAGLTVGVLNAGISGNGFFGDGGAKARFDRDVLRQAGVKWVIVSDAAVNDLNNGNPASLAQLTGVVHELAEQAHAAGVKFLCSTLTPFHGTPQWTPGAEATRAGLHAYMRSAASGCDAIVDQAAATGDPSDPTSYAPVYDVGDHLHPNEEGMQAIADAVPLSAFGATLPPPPTPTLPPVSPSTHCGRFLPGQGLLAGQTLVSCDGRYTMNMQLDGNLVIYDANTPIWWTGTVNQPAAEVLLRADGNFVLYARDASVLWQSASRTTTDVAAWLQGDGNFVIYDTVGPIFASKR
jgi:lysophospholipase L1-like esterase